MGAGLVYLTNFDEPYLLWLPALLLAVLALLLLVTRSRPWWIRRGGRRPATAGLRAWCRARRRW